jgi:regulator of replication initiation timing
MAVEGEATTSIDALVDLIQEKGKMELGKVASTLGVDPTIVENWAKICESGSILRISYEMGKMYIEPILITKEQELTVRAQLGVESTIAEQEVVAQRLSLDKLSETLATLEESVKSADRIFQQKMPEIQQKLDAINKIYTALEDDTKRVDQLRKSAEDSASGFNKRVADLYAKIDAINTGEIPRKIAANITNTEAALRKAEEIQAAMQQAARAKRDALEEIRRSVDNQLRAVKADVDKIEHDVALQFKIFSEEVTRNMKEINEEARQLQEVKSSISGFSRERDKARKAIDDAKASFNDQFAKTYARMNQSDSALKSSTNVMLGELKELRGNFGEASKIFDVIQSVKGDVQTLSAQVATYKAEVSKLLDELKAIDASTKKSVESRYSRLQSLKQRSKEIKENVSNINRKADSASSTFGEIVK